MGPQNMHMTLMSLSTPEATVYGSAGPPPPENGFVFLFWKGRGVKLLLVFLGKSLPKISNNS